MLTTTKLCPKCGVEKDRASGFGFRSGWCRECMRVAFRDRYRNDPEYRERAKARHRRVEAEKRADPIRNAQTLAALRERRATDAEWRQHKLDLAKAHRRRFLGRHLCQGARRRSKRDGRECTLDPMQMQKIWEDSPFCAYCSKQLMVSDDTHAHDSPTLERVDQTKGYTPENTVFACYRCNTIKRDATLDELEALATNVRRVLNP
jgi:hypothetical protein